LPDLKGKLLTALGQVSGRYICEIGCGGGGLTRELATRGARVSALDISAEALSLTRERNKEFIPGQVDVQQMDVSNLLFNDESFDLVVGVSILHHVDIGKAAVEVSRVLKPGGKAVFIEPLAHNPIANLWRRLSPSARTPDELPLSYSEISEMGKHFSSVNCREFALVTLLSSFVYLITHSNKAKIKSAELLDRLEPSFLKVCKPLRRYSGAVLIEFTK
jgi:2-polyprenyl-3-methyl-5-hydroxy-6-metoxy-1,4-benzoquinol methylase